MGKITKKDYIKFADIIRKRTEESYLINKDILIEIICEFLEEHNPSFDKGIFIKRCMEESK